MALVIAAAAAVGAFAVSVLACAAEDMERNAAALAAAEREASDAEHDEIEDALVRSVHRSYASWVESESRTHPEFNTVISIRALRPQRWDRLIARLQSVGFDAHWVIASYDDGFAHAFDAVSVRESMHGVPFAHRAVVRRSLALLRRAKKTRPLCLMSSVSHADARCVAESLVARGFDCSIRRTWATKSKPHRKWALFAAQMRAPSTTTAADCEAEAGGGQAVKRPRR